MELSIEQLSKRFGSKIAVNGISVSFQPGVYGLLGANGAGKTTLMRMACDILKPTSGRILCDGQNISHLGDQYRNLLGYLPQDFGYYPDFTAKEYLDFIAAVKGLEPAQAKRKVAEVLETVNLSDVSGKKIHTFSGGMKQRLGIAQAVVNDPKILVLDEPTAGLDPKERMRFRNLIAELAKNKIVILSTHIVSDIDYIADDILMMKDGSLILNCAAEEAIHSMDGKVWTSSVHPSKIDEVSNRFRVVNLHHEAGNEVSLRIVSDTQPIPRAVRAAPTLDDLYLYHFEDEEVRRDER
ncbi:MAG: ABC transporter ATP-binding protein [Clostridiales bacterium]|nr:ABC transporter ATP-binding protein [Clostridiales bacterium]